jgi:TRAP-type C4-dicarboxylate transport system permease large subunit
MRALVGLLVALVIGYFVYRGFFMQSLPQEAGGGTPVSAITTTGVRNDLIAIANAERAWFAEHGSYASLSELTSSGAMTMTRSGRDGYTYSVDTQAGGFTVTARYSGPLTPPPSGFMIDQSMEVRAIP